MGNVITGLLTDANLRDLSSVEKALIARAKIAAPWGGNSPES